MNSNFGGNQQSKLTTANQWVEELSPKFHSGPRNLKGNNPNAGNQNKAANARTTN